MSKILIFSAPSGSGKTTIVRALMSKLSNLEFSISACSRAPRGKEKNGIDYYFLSQEDFKAKIVSDDFLEWQEVYPDSFYGTLESEVEKIRSKGANVVFDVDVVGGLNIKKHYGEKALSIFVMPPSIDVLRERLMLRSTDSSEAIEKRITKAEAEITYANKFDIIVINDNIDTAIEEAMKVVTSFLKK